MPEPGSVVVIGGTRGLGLEIARRFAEAGREVVLTGRDPTTATAVAAGLSGRTIGIPLELERPEEIAGSLAGVGRVHHLVLGAMERDAASVREYEPGRALRLVTAKLVGYTEVIHVLVDRLDADASILLFGGRAKDRPYPGSTTISTVNAGVDGLVQTLAVELAPIRVNALHPGIVGDSPYWAARPPAALEAVRARTPTGRLVQMADVVAAAAFLLENPSVNGVSLPIDGGWLLL